MRCSLAVFLVVTLAGAGDAGAWGLRSHRWINERAISTLPSPLRESFERHREHLSDLAVEPDTILRKRDGRREAVRHFIDLDLYGLPPFRELPRSRRAAARKFGSRVVSSRGTLPWRILDLHTRLRQQMAAGRVSDAMRTAGLVGHYVGDAFMPLHTTDNHDGQRTGNRGIHRFVERDLVDGRFERFRLRAERHVGNLSRAPFTRERVFAILLGSYEGVDDLIRADLGARRSSTPPSAAYLDSLEATTAETLARRLGGAVQALGDLWFSAWEAAGKPSLGGATGEVP